MSRPLKRRVQSKVFFPRHERAGLLLKKPQFLQISYRTGAQANPFARRL
jgi:hypothetical protein